MTSSEAAVFPAKMAVEPLWKFARYPVSILIAGVAFFAVAQYFGWRLHFVMPWAAFIAFMIVWVPLDIVFCLALRQVRLVISSDGLTYRSGFQSVQAPWNAVSLDTVGSKAFLTMDPADITSKGIARPFRRDRVGQYSVIPVNYVQHWQGRELSSELMRHVSEIPAPRPG